VALARSVSEEEPPMAIVRQLVLQQLEGEAPHSEADCTYSLIPTPEGTYLQIDTYGSRRRQIVGKKSQSIRFAPEAIEQLKGILSQHFAQ
jgi:hypothetical protein